MVLKVEDAGCCCGNHAVYGDSRQHIGILRRLQEALGGVEREILYRLFGAPPMRDAACLKARPAEPAEV